MADVVQLPTRSRGLPAGRTPPRQPPPSRKPRRPRGDGRPSSIPVVIAFGAVAALSYFAFRPVQTDAVSGTYFRMCEQPPHYSCVIDGDTFYVRGQAVRISDIDTPETRQPQCIYEAELGARASRRLLALLNTGPFTLERHGVRDADQYGRKLRVVVRDGRSLGGTLVSEGLAREWTGQREPWCGA
jgi:micrococcal nuclease